MLKQLVLVGSGWAHLAVLQILARQAALDLRVVWITPHTHQFYANLLPGWIAGHYPLADGQIDLRPLAEAAGAELVLSTAVGLDADDFSLLLHNQTTQPYDILSLDIGTHSDLHGLEACGSRLLPLKPLDRFMQAWPRVLVAAQQQADYALAIVGEGSTSVELAFAAQSALRQRSLNAKVHLISSDFLKNHPTTVSLRVRQLLRQAGIRFHQASAKGIPTGLELSNGDYLAADQVIAATQGRPAPWLGISRLAVNEGGYLTVNTHQQSLSHANVFATGDICAGHTPHLEHSGAHMAHTGAVLAHNLLASIQGRPLRHLYPKAKTLNFITTGDKQAVVSWGNVSAAGTWAWQWKHTLDLDVLRRYQRLPPLLS